MKIRINNKKYIVKDKDRVVECKKCGGLAVWSIHSGRWVLLERGLDMVHGDVCGDLQEEFEGRFRVCMDMD